METGVLEGQTTIVTGASRGIGKAIALALAAEGSNVVFVARHRPDADLAAREAAGLGVESLAIEADVSSESDVQAMVERALARFGRIDVLVNNAGIPGPSGFITEIAAEDWDRTLNVNLKGMFLCAKAVVPQMMEQKRGNIINVSSGAGKRDKERSFRSPTRSFVYSVSKFGVEGFTLALASQVNPYRINVNALRPRATLTRFHDSAAPEKRAKMRKPGDIRDVAVFLARQGPLGITGESIDVETWESIYRERLND